MQRLGKIARRRAPERRCEYVHLTNTGSPVLVIIGNHP